MTDTPEIKDSEIQRLQIIALALFSGPTLFLGVIGFLALTGGDVEADADQDNSFLLILTAIACGMAIMMTIIGPILQRISTNNTMGQQTNMTPFMRFQTGMLMRYALIEGPALFGMVCLLLGVQSGDFPAYLWINLLPYALMGIVIFTTFPSRKSVEESMTNQTAYRK